MRERYDVVIVGARCAGSSLGAYLAARGVRTLIVDSAPLPSDMVMSTHYMQPPGMDVLDELGVGHRVRALAPAVRRVAASADAHKVVSLSRRPHGSMLPSRGVRVV